MLVIVAESTEIGRSMNRWPSTVAKFIHLIPGLLWLRTLVRAYKTPTSRIYFNTTTMFIQVTQMSHINSQRNDDSCNTLQLEAARRRASLSGFFLRGP